MLFWNLFMQKFEKNFYEVKLYIWFDPDIYRGHSHTIQCCLMNSDTPDISRHSCIPWLWTLICQPCKPQEPWRPSPPEHSPLWWEPRRLDDNCSPRVSGSGRQGKNLVWRRQTEPAERWGWRWPTSLLGLLRPRQCCGALLSATRTQRPYRGKICNIILVTLYLLSLSDKIYLFWGTMNWLGVMVKVVMEM